jgi:hypothetical protein
MKTNEPIEINLGGLEVTIFGLEEINPKLLDITDVACIFALHGRGGTADLNDT